MPAGVHNDFTIGAGDRCRGQVHDRDGARLSRPTTISAVGWDGAGQLPFFLLSGHGAMPWIDGHGIQRDWESDQSDDALVFADNAYVNSSGGFSSVVFGLLGGPADFCVAPAGAVYSSHRRPG